MATSNIKAPVNNVISSVTTNTSTAASRYLPTGTKRIFAELLLTDGSSRAYDTIYVPNVDAVLDHEFAVYHGEVRFGYFKPKTNAPMSYALTSPGESANTVLNIYFLT